MRNLIRIATRKSPLALWQATHIKQKLEAIDPAITVELLPLTTEGDRLLGTPLATIGGKGLFVKELEQALIEKRADIAVHSMKDVTVSFPPGLILAAICEREDPRDAFVSNQYSHLDEVPTGAIIGTASLRRQSLIRHLRPDLQIVTLRGNINTRLRRLDEAEFAAILLAVAGITRLGMAQRIKHYFDPEQFIPAVGQGALGIECREQDLELISVLQQLNHTPSQICVTAERAMNKALEGGCQVPIACYATISEQQLLLRGLVGKPDGSLILRAEVTGAITIAEALGKQLAEKLQDQGAQKILQEVYQQHG